MLHSLSWGLEIYYKEREKIWGKKLYYLTSLHHLFYLSSHIYLFLLFLFCLLFLPSPFLLCMLRLIIWARNALIGVFTESSDFCRSRGEWRSAAAVVAECGGISKAAFLCRYHAAPPSLSPFFLLPHPSMLQSSGVVVACEDRGWGGGTIGRVSILPGEMLQCQKARPMLAKSSADLCCTHAPEHTCG